jgi:hypothetical protein
MRSPVIIAALLLALSLPVTACRDGDDDRVNDTNDRGSAPTVVTGATATATPTAEESVLAAYLEYSDAYKQALFDLDARHLEGVASGEQLRRVRAEIESLRAQGLAGRIEMTHKPVVIEVSANSATVLDEVINNSFYVDAITKQPPVASGSGELLRDTFYLEKINGEWVVTQSVRQKQGGQ